MVMAYERQHPSYPRLSSKGYMLTDCHALLLSSHQPTLAQEAWALSVCMYKQQADVTVITYTLKMETDTF